MIICNNQVITLINKFQEELDDDLKVILAEKKINAVYKGSDLIWLTTYQVDIKSCYGSGNWLDNYNWVEDIWKN